MDNHWGSNCLICDAPLRSDEFKDHFRQCLLIEAKRTGKTDAELRDELKRELRDAAIARDVAATPQTPFPFGRHAAGGTWEDPSARPVVPGKTRCLACNGLVHMYPNCEPCGGTGSV